MRARGLCVVVVVATSILGTAPDGFARSLASKLDEFVSNVSIPLQGRVVDPIPSVIERLAIRGTDFPVTSTTPGFTYSYNPSLGLFERSSGSLGPAFGERAETLGSGRFDLGFSYLYADLADEGGENFARRLLMGSQVNIGGQPIAGAFQGLDFSLVSHVFSFSATYGLTDRWDVNLVVPVVYTALKLQVRAAAAIGAEGSPGLGIFSFSDFFGNDAVGVGDILLRTKYRFVDDASIKLAGLLALRAPSGNENDFQGLGDTTLTPSLVGSRAFGPCELHGNLGVEVNADDLQRTRARYGVGTALQPIDRLAFLVDFLGSSSFVDDTFGIPTRGRIVPSILPSDFIKSVGASEITAFVPRSDILDLAVGVKVHLVGTGVAFASAIVPLTSDGLRADVIPAGGVEFSF
jgi:hypothetical protein